MSIPTVFISYSRLDEPWKDRLVTRETAEKCSISADRLSAYTAILREYHIERDPGLARLFAEEEEED
jgi:hypothetical protein